MSIAQTPKPPYYAVIFTSVLSSETEGYEEMAEKMVELSSKMPGFLGIDSARSDVGITVCYWESLEDIQRWKNELSHQEAQQLGKEKWYHQFETRIAKVERAYGSN